MDSARYDAEIKNNVRPTPDSESLFRLSGREAQYRMDRLSGLQNMRRYIQIGSSYGHGYACTLLVYKISRHAHGKVRQFDEPETRRKTTSYISLRKVSCLA